MPRCPSGAGASPLPAQNGTVLKCEALAADGDAGAPAAGTLKGYRVIYKTTALTHTGNTTVEVPLPASGTVWIPAGAIAPPASADAGAAHAPLPLTRPVIADTHGAVGVLPICGPSRTGSFSTDPFSIPAVLTALGTYSPGRAPVSVPIFVGQVRGDPLIDSKRTGSFVASAVSTNLITFCEYYGGTAVNAAEQNLYMNLNWTLRANDHNAFAKCSAARSTASSARAAAWGCLRPRR